MSELTFNSTRNGHANGSHGAGARPTLITGGAGFIGTNMAHHLASRGGRVLIFDNLSRPGVERNWQWLRETHGERVELIQEDIRDASAVRAAVNGVGLIYHFAAQVAVTTSLDDPCADFETNARGTLNLLEAARAQSVAPTLVYTSTNKVYGGLEDVKLTLQGARYEPQNADLRASGISETRPLDFHSPYGCSKGAADQYVRDYARSFDLPTIVFRMSCIYGPHQCGTEDQGWVAHFVMRALAGEPITIFGDGKQVRDILFATDLVNALDKVARASAQLRGEVFNVGGGPRNTVSLLELIDLLGEINGAPLDVTFEDWRVGDQRYYVSDTRRLMRETGWRAQTDVRAGVQHLCDWIAQHGALAEAAL